MPFRRLRSLVSSVMVQGTLYVEDGYSVREYDTSSGKWGELPPYRTYGFGMAVISNQLVLVGGYQHGQRSKVVGVWSAERREWTHPYPDMATARCCCSAVGYNEWLVVAGGCGDGGRLLSSVEVLNTDSKQWYAGPPTPTGWACMRTAVVGDVCYFMGGHTGEPGTFGDTATDKVFSVSLSALTSQLQQPWFYDIRATRSKQLADMKGHHAQLVFYASALPLSERSRLLWKEIAGLQVKRSTPLSMSGWLLAVGGRGEDGNAVSAIHLYQPATGEWVKVGDLPTPLPRYGGICTVIGDVKILVGGECDPDNSLISYLGQTMK